MPNIGAMLKQEITRLARREVRAQVQATKKASTQYRRHIAALRRQVTALEHQLATLGRRSTPSAPPASDGGEPQKIRFVAKGLKSQRARLGLSAADFGRLVGVSAQSIYNWEQGNATPRAGQLAILAARRGIGKREALKLLEQPVEKKKKRRAAPARRKS